MNTLSPLKKKNLDLLAEMKSDIIEENKIE